MTPPDPRHLDAPVYPDDDDRPDAGARMLAWLILLTPVALAVWAALLWWLA